MIEDQGLFFQSVLSILLWFFGLYFLFQSLFLEYAVSDKTGGTWCPKKEIQNTQAKELGKVSKGHSWL